MEKNRYFYIYFNTTKNYLVLIVERTGIPLTISVIVKFVAQTIYSSVCYI